MKTKMVEKIIVKEQELTLEYLNECKPYIPEESESRAVLESYISNINILYKKYHEGILELYIKLIDTRKIYIDPMIDLFIALLKETTKISNEEKVKEIMKNYVAKVSSGIIFKAIEKSIVDNIIEAYEKEDVDIIYSIKDFIGIDIKDIIILIEQLQNV